MYSVPPEFIINHFTGVVVFDGAVVVDASDLILPVNEIEKTKSEELTHFIIYIPELDLKYPP